MSSETFLHTSDATTTGQLDKLCDLICERVVDACLKADDQCRVNVQCCIKSRMVILFGDITLKSTLDYDSIVRTTLASVGYVSEEKFGLDERSMNVVVAVSEGSPDISQLVGIADDSAAKKKSEAIVCSSGDMGTGIGYATNEDEIRYMPLSHTLSSVLARQLTTVREEGILPWLKPDGKVSVIMEYEKKADGSVKAKSVKRICVHAPGHDPSVSLGEMQEGLRRQVVDVVVGKRTGKVETAEGDADSGSADKLPTLTPNVFTPLITDDTVVHVNYSSHKSNRAFVGPNSDDYLGSGASGQRNAADLYGNHVSAQVRIPGRDALRVDRFSSFAARWIAKSIVASKLASRCQVSLSYSSSLAEPVSLSINSFGSISKEAKEKLGISSDKALEDLVRGKFDLRVGSLVAELGLRKAQYSKLACFGYMGNEGKWEEVRDLLA